MIISTRPNRERKYTNPYIKTVNIFMLIKFKVSGIAKIKLISCDCIVFKKSFPCL